MNFSTKIKLFAVTAMLALTLISCDDPVVNDVQNDVNNIARNAQIAQETMQGHVDHANECGVLLDNVWNECK